MVTDEERREVARKLRESARAGEFLDYAIVKAVTSTADLSDASKNGVPIGYIVADFIEPQERTCHDVRLTADPWRFTCSRCGANLADGAVTDAADEEIEPRYCPNCGARITEVDDA